MPIIVDPETESAAVGDAVAVSDLVDRVRRQLRDWPDEDEITADVGANNQLIHVADTSIYSVNWPLQIDGETMIVRSLNSATVLSCRRGAYGSTAAAHSEEASVLIKPRFFNVEILDALADGIDAAFPYIYKRVTDTTLTTVASTFEYELPAMPSDSDQVIPFIWKVETKRSGEDDYVEVRSGAWNIVRQAASKIRFHMEPEAGSTIRLNGYGHFPRLTTEGNLDLAWPRNMQYPLVEYAVSQMLASGEYGRVSVDRGMSDQREQANKTGSSSAASQYALQRYLRRVQQSGYPPMSRHAKKVI